MALIAAAVLALVPAGEVASALAIPVTIMIAATEPAEKIPREIGLKIADP